MTTYCVQAYENVTFQCLYHVEAGDPEEAREKVELGEAEFLGRKELTGEVFDIPLSEIREVNEHE